MATFSTNQVKQLYVCQDPIGSVKEGCMANPISLTKDGKYAYFEYKGAKKNMMRSDLIPVDNIKSATVTSYKVNRKELKAVKVVLDEGVNGGLPILGEDYLLRIEFSQYLGMSDEDKYYKYGAVHVTSNINTAGAFYKEMAKSLIRNFKREVTPLVKIGLINTSNAITYCNTIKDVEGVTPIENIKGLIISEVEQDWVLGTMSRTRVYFDVCPTEVTYKGMETKWGYVEKGFKPTTPEYITNTKDLADLEYFCLGERGDIYRNVSFPHVIPQKYLVNTEDEYQVITITYSFKGTGVNVQESDKEIVILWNVKAEQQDTDTLSFLDPIKDKFIFKTTQGFVKGSDVSSGSNLNNEIGWHL